MSRRWTTKFVDAFRGMREGVRGGTSFRDHSVITFAVVIAAAVLRLSALEWCVILLCITIVFSAEFFNTALEAMARAVTKETDPHIRDALDIAAGAVMTAAIGSVVVGVVLFGYRVGQLMKWW
jgi:diacylglycerol kinase